MAGQLAALLGEPPTAPLEFASAVDLTRGYGASLARYLVTAVSDLEQAGSVLSSHMARGAIEQFIMTAMLVSHPHNYSNALRRCEKPLAPRDVRRAIDYIEAHIGRAITVADLVEATGVAGRTLFMHFKTFEGISPMRYVRNARLKRARHTLLRADPDASVTGIAMSLGFAHLGRFSVQYRRRFGETPSQTLRQRHRGRRLMPAITKP